MVKSLRNLLCRQPLRSCSCFASLVCCPANLLTSLFFLEPEPALFRLRAGRARHGIRRRLPAGRQSCAV